MNSSLTDRCLIPELLLSFEFGAFIQDALSKVQDLKEDQQFGSFLCVKIIRDKITRIRNAFVRDWYRNPMCLASRMS